MSNTQKVDLYQPVEASRVGPPPLVIKAIVTPNRLEMAGGVPMSTRRVENYVLLSALPEELQRRIELAVQALVTAG